MQASINGRAIGNLSLCLQLYTQEFYQNVILRKLAEGGIYVTQAGPAGVLTCTEVHCSAAHAVYMRVSARAMPAVHVSGAHPLLCMCQALLPHC